MSVGGSGDTRLLRKCLRVFSPSEWGMQVHSDVTSIVNKYLGSKLGVWLMSSEIEGMNAVFDVGG